MSIKEARRDVRRTALEIVEEIKQAKEDGLQTAKSFIPHPLKNILRRRLRNRKT